MGRLHQPTGGNLITLPPFRIYDEDGELVERVSTKDEAVTKCDKHPGWAWKMNPRPTVPEREHARAA